MDQRPTDFPARGGQWTYDPVQRIVSHSGSGYVIALEELTTAGGLLERLLHVASQSWQTLETLGELVALLQAISQELFEKTLPALFCPPGEAPYIAWPTGQRETETER